jgi:hypothetical protein
MQTLTTRQQTGGHAMTTLIVLFNLREGVDPESYEQWAAKTDLPTVRKLRHCRSFDLFRGKELLGTDEPTPFQYVELIEIDDLAAFREETATETMRRVATEFRTFADRPQFMVMERLEA